MKKEIEELNNIIKESNNIVFFGGAGVSTESGIPDFRSVDGLYNMKYDYPPEIILSHSFFLEHPDIFYKFYYEKLIYEDVLPNDCHIKLKELEDSGKLKGIVTQNIDGLHEMAGTNNIALLHGTIYKNTCMKCGKKYLLDDVLKFKPNIPTCSCGGIIKPDVVLYEEPLDDETVKKARELISNADTLIVGGTSLNVYPAASLIYFFQGKNLVIINKEKLMVGCTLQINDSIATIFKNI